MNNSIPIKTLEELEYIRHGGAILKQSLELASTLAKPGISTLEIDQEVEKFIRSHEGCTPGFKGYGGFPGSLCISINDEVVHGIPSNDVVLMDGDIVGVDGGVYYKGMHTDACRTFLVGDVKPEIKHFVKITKKALDQAIKQVKPGNHIGDISAVIQKTLETQGYSPVIECTGHGVGKDLHEAPTIFNAGKKGTGALIKAGMVFAIEPISTMGKGDIVTLEDGWTIVSEDESLSAHFEHTVIVTENGCEVVV